MGDLSIIVTGAGSGIGLSIVRLLLKNTTVALVVAVDIKISALQELELEYSPKLKILEGDISKRRANEEAVQAAIGQTGRLDAIILNAGILGPISPAVDGDVNEWTKLFEINFFGPLHGVQVAFPHLRKSGGRIIFTSSGVSLRLTKSWAAYSSAKAALNHLCASLAHEEPSISTVSVTPGIVDTDIQRLVREQHKDTLDPAMYNFLVDLHSQGKLLHPDQPAATFVKLAMEGIPPEVRGQTVAWDNPYVKGASSSVESHGAKSTLK